MKERLNVPTYYTQISQQQNWIDTAHHAVTILTFYHVPNPQKWIINNWLIHHTTYDPPPLFPDMFSVNGIYFFVKLLLFLSSHLPTRPPVLWALIGGTEGGKKTQQLITEKY